MKPAPLTAKDLAYPLDSLSLDDLTLAGGKASKLSLLKRAGFPVPDGFVLMTEAYQAFVEYNAFATAIAAHMASVSPEKPETAEAAAQAIRSQLSQGSIPNENAALSHLETTPQARPVVEQLTLFLSEHGHRCPAEAEIMLPRWAEAPEQVVELIAGYLRAGDGVNPVAAETVQRAMRETAQAEIAGRLGPLRRKMFRFLLAQASNAIRQRDNSRHHLAKIDLPRRRLYAELGRRWAERGWLNTAEDIFFLLHREIEAVVAANDPAALHEPLQTLVVKRRKAYDFWCMVNPPEALDAEGRPLVDPVSPGATSDDAVLQGIPASGGLARGVARLVQDPRDAARLQPGDILITRSTDPGWTPVFPLVSGLVLEMGGQLSHGAIVAREYGVPAVVNVYGALSRISDGALITVDGTQGLVYLPEAMSDE
ncbi:MAG: PEP-utilizing enzyme [Chloroflexales bacterium]|nr:PEP-utilizing enzyme [Chloroflexales bacterium]